MNAKKNCAQTDESYRTLTNSRGVFPIMKSS
jgi:hypothetical protein